VGAVGMGGIHTFENDTGPDEANHDWYGIFVLSALDGASPLQGDLGDLSIYDVAPTVLRLFGQSVPADMIGASLIG
jgi:predicted AlkP superfamily phosphohydrolase/phosphomutase